MMLGKLGKIWNYDFRHMTERQVGLMTGTAAVLVLCVVFGIYDLLFDTGAGFFGQSKEWMSKHFNPFQKYLSPQAFYVVLWVTLIFLSTYITAIAVHGFFLSLRRYGARKFAPIFWSHFLSNVVILGFNLAFFALLGGIAYAAGLRYADGENFFQNAVGGFEKIIRNYIPTLVNVPAPFALLAGAFIGGFPGFFSHWLCHKFRLLWYVSHRCHHTAEIMHPAGIGPFTFLPEVFLALPTVIFTAAATKLFSYEPMIAASFLVGIGYVLTEKFSHNTAHYNFAYGNPVLRHISHYYGNGVYHYMHHTARQGDEIVNMSGAPFMLWDRVFGLYRAPTKIAPPVGLTNTPVIVLSPFKIMFAGFEQIGYELRHNKGFIMKLKIIFGDIYFKPPISKDFLILGYPEVEVVNSENVVVAVEREEVVAVY